MDAYQLQSSSITTGMDVAPGVSINIKNKVNAFVSSCHRFISKIKHLDCESNIAKIA